MLYGQGRYANLATVVTALVVVAGFWGHVPTPSLFGWLGALLAVAAARSWLVHRWTILRPPPEVSRRWIRRYLVGAACGGLSWGAAAFLVDPAGSALHQVFLFVVLGAVGSGAVAVLSPVWGAFLLFAGGALLPMAVRLLVAGDDTHLAMGGLLILLFAVLAVVSRRIHQTITDALVLRHENRGLVAQLTESNRSLRVEVEERERINQGLLQRDAILQAVSFAAARLLKAGSWRDEIQGILDRLGKATRVSRVYVFTVHDLDRLEGARVRQVFEWVAAGVEPQIDNPDLQDISFAEVGFGRWLEVLGGGDVLSGPVSELPPSEGELLAAQDIQSVAVVPIFVRDEWWGFLGFDDCAAPRLWSAVETDALRAAADTLGAAIQGHRAEEARRESEERFRLLAEHTRDLVCLHEPSGRYVYLSPSSEALLGYRPEELLGVDPYELFLPEDRERIRREAHERVLHGQPSHTITYRMRRKSGEYAWLESVTEPVLDGDGKVVQLVTSTREITERKRAEEQLFYEKELAQVTLQSIGDGVITTDAAGLITGFNPVAEKLTGWQPESAVGRPLSEVFLLIDEARHRAVEDLVGSILREEGPELPEHAGILGPGGREFAIQVSAAPIRDRKGRILGTVTVFRDVTKTRELAQQLSYQATHDALTGLINRREFDNRLRTSLARVSEGEPHDVLCYLDLDQFKVVNDTCGHVAGDELLRQLATYLQSRVRRDDSLARLGGDEFGVLLHRCPLERARQLAGELCRGIRDLRFTWKDRVFVVGASIGLVSISGELESVADILRAADAACYAAKDRGRNRVQVYQPDDTELARRQGEMQWVSRIHDALAADRFQLYFQPIRRPGAIAEGAGLEILVSMRDEDGGLVPPGAFIPAAERYNLMPSIDRWVVSRTFESFAEHWRRRPPNGDGACFINLSGTSLMDDSFLPFVEEELARHDIPPDAVCFEITETAAIANLTEATRFMQRLKKLGCRFALDDFGSGLSSFAHLKALPVDYLKIDGAFVKDIEVDSVDFAMVEAINHIGHLLGLATIAEYVETEGILTKVAALGVDLVQGYAVGRPRPVEELTEVFARS